MDPHATRDGAEIVAARFVTASGDQVAAVGRSTMREIDRIAVEETGPSLLQMMENAGRAMAQLVLERLNTPRESRVLVLAGVGGNGGGGICAARHLAPRVDRIDVCLVRPHDLSSAGAAQLATYRHTTGREVPLHALDDQAPYDVTVDALIGYGLAGAPRGPESQAIEWTRRSDVPVFALDVPSGLDCDTGDTPGAKVHAALTVTLHLPKPGLHREVAGRLYLADLGIPAAATRSLGITPPTYDGDFVTRIERC